jgi:tRNA-splicing ligase RtcB (3'-phosphate/5'-hydroxy nucleic acid ligase)
VNERPPERDLSSPTMVFGDEPYRELDGGLIRVWGYSYDSQAVEQIRTVSQHGHVAGAALMADNHVGYSMPIGGVAAYRDMISPSGVGYDIGCGVQAVRTTLKLDDVRTSLPRLADAIADRISFGIGRKNARPVDHPLFDSPTWGEVPYLTETHETRRGRSSLRDLAVEQLGTVGSGNHYVDLLVEADTGDLWVACHFGSRGFGHRIATGFLNLPDGRPFHSHATGGESMMAPPTLLPLTEDAARSLSWAQDPAAAADAGRAYKLAMELAGEYAYAGRDHVIEQVLGILGAEATYRVHNHHNFSWTEDVDGAPAEVVRKGATPAYPGQTGFVGGSMGDIAVVVRGVDAEGARRALHSTVHGAGRVMSRSQARGNRRGTRPGRISHEMMEARLDEYRREHSVPLERRGGDVDESPFVYRPLRSVLDAHVATGTAEIVTTLLPVAVCMAGSDVRDPYKD